MMDYPKLYELIKNTEIQDGIIVKYHDAQFEVKIREGIIGTGLGAMSGKWDFDVLISKEVSYDERKLCLLHEIVELCLIRFYGYRPWYADSGAHDIAVKHEELYQKWLVTTEIYKGWADENDLE